MAIEVTPAARRPAAVVALRTARRATRSGVLWGYLFGLTVASSALGYTSTYKTVAERERFAALFTSNAGLAALNGPARRIQTVAGYTVWKSFMFLMVLGGVWGLLTATRLLRGEEDAGRWELLLAGQTTRRRAAAQAVGGLGAGLVVLWALTAVITVLVGRMTKVDIAAGPALYFAVAIVAPAAMFLAGGALASQLASTRRQAAAYTGAALGICYALRLVADSGSGLAWLRWSSPLGWVEELQPLTGSRAAPLVPIITLVVVLAGAAVHLAGRRDLDAGVLPDAATGTAHTALLSRPLGLAWRLTRPAMLGWVAAIAATSVLMGFIAKAGGSVLTSTASVERVASRLGWRGGGAAAYLSLTFLTVAVMVAFVAASQLGAARAEEAEDRLDHLLARAVSRSSWLGDWVALAAAMVIADGVLAGLFAWIGAASQQSGVGLASLLDAGLNVVPPTLCILGLGVLAIGVRPRATSVVTYGVLAWSILVDLLGGFFSSNHWLLDTSVFHQMAAAPAVTPDWTSGAVLVAVAALAALAGGVAFGRRDLTGR